MTDPSMPTYKDLLWPTIEALRELGGSASIDEIAERAVKRQGFTEVQQQVLHGNGPQTEIEYRLAWARSYLKGMGLGVNSRRGVWSLTDDGQRVVENDLEALHRKYVTSLRRDRSKEKDPELSNQSDPERSQGGASGWRDELLDLLLEMHPSEFEHLIQRLLREAGFINVAVTGKTGDGGIDGLGVYRLSLVSFPVFFQCKRYRGSVGAPAVRDFRGAMAGRGDKGLLVTTGAFTSEARAEATRDGAPPIDLIDGLRLADLLKEYELGVTTTVRQVEDVQIDRTFFARTH